mmetsp:Transcript_69653/g.110450  ORF Transcript_69653/g.110450 Transcript_69653/m.110450 type:complete len:216 (+) Transcript_69653:403-1050(+)
MTSGDARPLPISTEEQPDSTFTACMLSPTDSRPLLGWRTSLDLVRTLVSEDHGSLPQLHGSTRSFKRESSLLLQGSFPLLQGSSPSLLDLLSALLPASSASRTDSSDLEGVGKPNISSVSGWCFTCFPCPSGEKSVETPSEPSGLRVDCDEPISASGGVDIPVSETLLAANCSNVGTFALSGAALNSRAFGDPLTGSTSIKKETASPTAKPPRLE